MTQASQKMHKDHSQLPAIEQKQSHKTEKDQMDRHQDQNNVLPLTHEKKKRKFRKKLRKHSPQYYEQIRLKRLNKKLQQKWDSHFINDQIPDIFDKKKAGRKTLTKLIDEKRSSTALKNRLIGNKTTEIGLKKQTMPLPKIQKVDKRSKSFNIHVVSQKQQDTLGNKRKQDATLGLIETKLSTSSNQRSRKMSQQQKEKAEQKQFLEEYKKKLNEIFHQKKFLNSHKQMIESFLQKIGKKNVRQMLDEEFSLLRKNESSINKIMKAIQNRQRFLQDLNKLILKSNKDQKQLSQTVDLYRTATLAVVEEILKWKEAWQAVYFQHFKKSHVFQLIYKTHGYLYTLFSSADETLRNFHKLKQSKQKTKTQKLDIKKTQQVKVQAPKQKLENSPKEPKNIPEDSDQKKQQIVESIQQTKREEKIEENKPKEPQNKQINKIPQTKKEEKVEIKQPQQKQKTKTQHKEISTENEKIIQLNDPFLISLYPIDKEDKNIILKVRACELLLIQQQYNFLRK